MFRGTFYLGKVVSFKRIWENPFFLFLFMVSTVVFDVEPQPGEPLLPLAASAGVTGISQPSRRVRVFNSATAHRGEMDAQHSDDRALPFTHSAGINLLAMLLFFLFSSAYLLEQYVCRGQEHRHSGMLFQRISILGTAASQQL